MSTAWFTKLKVTRCYWRNFDITIETPNETPNEWVARMQFSSGSAVT